MNAQRITPAQVGGIIARQNDTGTKIDRPSVKACQEIRLNPDVFDVRVIGWQLLGGNRSRELQLYSATAARVEVNALHVTVLVTRSIHRLQVVIRIEERLNVVVARGKRVETRDGESCGALVDRRNNARSEVVHVAAEDWRRGHSGFTDSVSRLGTVGPRDDDHETAGGRPGAGCDFKTQTRGLRGHKARGYEHDCKNYEAGCAHFCFTVMPYVEARSSL